LKILLFLCTLLQIQHTPKVKR